MKKFLVIAFYVLVVHSTATAQNEKVTIESSEETMEEGRFSKLLGTYNDIVRIQEEKLTLFKIDLISPIGFIITEERREVSENNLDIQSTFRFAYEKKYRPAWSWLVATKLRLDELDIVLSGGVRYYYNINRRILKGKSANNFSANYLSLQPDFRITEHYESFSPLTLKMLYGIQRRLGKRGYFDVNVGLVGPVETMNEKGGTITGTASVELGLAF
ncbi:hypothetical protein QQ008_08825 [Fulvivirgaceae bacterium BMA10]|uniref:DUF481 domain-containing protein n=1 Tax=Splendidivirga corallicola TaxID=3051826 RepID=A0ABT8KLZ8_9BACT|nr:hypothetical protein [Fulvivirgaceae bacterium BMA10]